MADRRATRILYLSPYGLHRATCASELRALAVARALQAIAQVEVAVVDGEGRGPEWAACPNPEFHVAYSAVLHPRPNSTLSHKLRWMMDPRSIYPHGCGVDDEAARRVRDMAKQYDLIWFCKVRTANMFPYWSWPNSVTDIDDVPSTIERAAWHNARGFRERFLAALRLQSWRRRDRRLGERFSVLGVCSDPDRRYMQSLKVDVPLHVIPNGFDRPQTDPQRCLSSPPRLGFIGIFDYPPNLEGLKWFVREAWPLIKRQVPDVRLRLVGRLSDGPLKPSGPDIDGLGWVEDANAEMSTWSAMIVPIQLGGGTRGKIAHAFSQKCPVVSTSLGAYGYEAVNGREMILGDSAENFAEGCVKAIRQPTEAAQMAERAWQQFLNRWTWDAIKPRVWAAAEECLRLCKDRAR